MVSFKEVRDGFGSLFYAVNPYDSMFKTIPDLPERNYIQQAGPYFLVLVILEHIGLLLKGKPGIRFNDGLMSVANGYFMNIRDATMKNMLMFFYIYIYDNYCIYELPWDSVWTWIIAALGCDLSFYWVHRASHELNILWASHQVHHSSEEFNLTTALRQPFMKAFQSWPFYLPLAFFVPPTHVIVHMQFNVMYQFWLHTEVVTTLGPLEYILNTPQHHRVHHGSNRYCLDTNYAGVLIIWDMIFGTFAWERHDDGGVVYGLVDQPQYFNPFRHQVEYYYKVFQKAYSMNTWSDKISALLKGPGWFPGTERLGDLEQVPERQTRTRYNPQIPVWTKVYAAAHFVLVVIVFDYFSRFTMVMSQTTALVVIGLIIWTLTNLGFICDKRPWDWFSEIVRCGAVLMLLVYYGSLEGLKMPKEFVFWAFSASMVIAIIASISKLTNVSRSDNVKKQS
ncbi:alkylglycerol monooxygenase-like [Tigriopus californicus]|uniref:alkylglycerol monooxygenase-like n=1 Tax=Tigriopus californicus TaxID=6832 RepID=UPI0027DA6F5F|nr:alkylglycerol monooxygenase-like [Tigriopus californicus]